MRLRHPRPATLAMLAGALWLLALLGFGAALEGYSQMRHPVALLGARGVAHGVGFDVLGLVVPGLLMAGAAVGLRRHLAAAGWSARVGAQLLLLSALAFAAQGVLPLDPSDLDATASRLHATAWSLWWLAWLAGAVLLAIGARGARIVAIACIGLALLAALLVAGGIGQRTAIAAWFALGILVPWRVARATGHP